MSSRKPSLILSMLRMKCPSCRKGDAFINKHIFPLGDCLKMPDRCPICAQKMEVESYKGQGMNYILTMLTFFLNIFWYWPIFGISYKDNSIFYFAGTSAFVVILLQPFYMRMSRMIYLYFLIKYGSGPKFKEQANS